ncbi:MAG: hypothetical protein QGH25_19275, partial [Candidatus Latescibacteria bacterium]|nr:hypothetical protein [Candidatus Latescibacterota bacterium]
MGVLAKDLLDDGRRDVLTPAHQCHHSGVPRQVLVTVDVVRRGRRQHRPTVVQLLVEKLLYLRLLDDMGIRIHYACHEVPSLYIFIASFPILEYLAFSCEIVTSREYLYHILC